VTNPTETWRIETEGGLVTPAVVGETVYVSAGVGSDGDEDRIVGSLAAFDRENGQQQWQCVFDELGGAYAGCPPIVHRGSVYVGDAGHHSFYAVDARTGEIRWHADLGGSVNYPAVAAAGVICLAQQEEIIAFDTMGEELWRYSKPGHYFLNTPSVVAETVYVASGYDGEMGESEDDHSSLVAALDLRTGEVVWEVNRGENFGTVSTADGVLYLAGANALHALDADDGERLWEQSAGETRFRDVALDDEHVFAAGGNRVVALNRDDGTVRWTYEANTYIRTTPTVTENSVIASTDNPQSDDTAVTYALDRTTGEVRWSFELDGSSSFPAAAGDERVYLPSYQNGQGGVLLGLESANE
jgi:outer membrane protein assembly factor BamB